MQPRGEHWSAEEVEAVVADYFSMLEKELSGIPYNKSEHRRRLKPLLNGRSDGSIERKHGNISAILIEARHPYIRGYKPFSQYQMLLSDMVLDRLDDDAALQALASTYADSPLEVPAITDVLRIMTTPPDLLESARLALAAQRQRRIGRTIDYLAREARNRTIGTGGESLVVSYERARLSRLGLGNLAARVEHVAKTRGDGLGYDVLSFETSGADKYIEVKTTKLGPMTPFYVTTNELEFSREHRHEYSLYRVYDFAATPSIFALNGAVDASCALSASTYVAVPR